MPTLIAAAAFCLAFVLLTALFVYTTRERQVVRERLVRFVEPRPATEVRVEALTAFSGELTGWRAVVRRASRYFEWARWSRSVEHKLVKAGLPLKGAEFAAICFATAMLGALLLNSLTGGRATGPAAGILPGFIGSMLGYLAPQVYLDLRIRKRGKAFDAQLGDALILAANSLRTGYSFLQAVEMVSREMRPPLSTEFARMLREMNLGVTTEDAMRNMTKRVDSSDLDLALTAVLIQRQVGGNLAEVLDGIAATIRERFKLKGDIKTLTAQGRVSGLIISFLPIALAVVIFLMNPGYIRTLFEHPLGRMMLVSSAVGMVAGFIWVRRIVNIDL